MPPRWPRKPDPTDPALRRLEDRINFAVHVALFAAVNSGIWFFDLFLKKDWAWPIWVTGAWIIVLIIHGIVIFKIVNYGSAEQT